MPPKVIRSPQKPNTRGRVNSLTADSLVDVCSCDIGKLYEQIAELKQIVLATNSMVVDLQANVSSLVASNIKANDEIARLNNNIGVDAEIRAKQDQSNAEVLKVTMQEVLYSEIAKTSLIPAPAPATVDTLDGNDVHKQKTIIGSCVDDLVLGPKVVAPKKTILVSQLHPSTEATELKSYLDDKLQQSGTAIQCKILIPKGKTRDELDFVGFMVIIPGSLYENVMSPTLWAKGVTVRDFIHHRKTRGQQFSTFLPANGTDNAETAMASDPQSLATM